MMLFVLFGLTFLLIKHPDKVTPEVALAYIAGVLIFLALGMVNLERKKIK